MKANQTIDSSNIRYKAVEKAIGLLKAAGATFHIVLGGNEFGKAVVKKQIKPRTGVTEYVRSFISGMEPHEVRCIKETAEYTLINIQSNASFYGAQMYGKGNFMTTKNLDKHAVEIMRVA